RLHRGPGIGQSWRFPLSDWAVVGTVKWCGRPDERATRWDNDKIERAFYSHLKVMPAQASGGVPDRPRRANLSDFEPLLADRRVRFEIGGRAFKDDRSMAHDI